MTALAISAFTLSWVHSVQKTEWRETWQVGSTGLEITSAQIKGSGAGMEPGEDAVFHNGWWAWKPSLLPQQQVVLAASGATPSGWTLCYPDGCVDLGQNAGDSIVLEKCQ